MHSRAASSPGRREPAAAGASKRACLDAQVDEAMRAKQTRQLDASVLRLEAAVFEARDAGVPKDDVLPAQVTLTTARASRRASLLKA